MKKKEYNLALLAYLSEYVTDHKKKKFEQVLMQRTRSLTVVLEDIYKSHNASAVMRSAECFGIQDIHVVEQNNPYTVNPYILRGAGKWLSMHRYHESEVNIKTCFEKLKVDGYKIVATSPHNIAKDFSSYEINEKTAVVFGTEETGISDYVKNNADAFVQIPMHGFTESFNLSVSAAIVLDNFNRQIRNRLDAKLTVKEISTLRLEWYKKMVPNLDAHIRKFDLDYENNSSK